MNPNTDNNETNADESVLPATACSVEFLLHGLLEHFYVDCDGELGWSYQEGYSLDDIDADLAKHLKAWREANEVEDAVD